MCEQNAQGADLALFISASYGRYELLILRLAKTKGSLKDAKAVIQVFVLCSKADSN